MKSISVFGLGYVGTVTAACLAHKGHRVLGVDVNPAKVAMLESGRSPVLEPGLDQLVADAHRAGRLQATTDPRTAINQSTVSFLCVGTPGLRNGRLDLSSVESICREIGEVLRSKQEFHWIVLRSTVLPGTVKSLAIPALEAASGKRAGQDFAVCSNPEFTREGCAVDDFLNPTITVFGADDPMHFAVLRDVYEGFPGRVFETSLAVAEMVKYMCNTFHALKVTFANEIGTLCEHLGVDAGMATQIFLSDTRLNVSPAYLKPGFAFGGSCLPKDVCALTYRAKELDLDLPILRAIIPSNQAHLERAIAAVLSTGKKKVGVLGLSFKPGTDDLRESPLVKLVKRLLGEGCQIQIWDRIVCLGQLTGSNRQFIEGEIPHVGSLLSTDLPEVIQEAEVVLMGTQDVDETILPLLRPDQIIIDLVNLGSSVSRCKMELTAEV